MSARRAFEPPYPSFTLVLSQIQEPSRLPSYRSTHALRYHPYPRYAPGIHRERDDPLMTTVDNRDAHEDLAPEPALAWHDVHYDPIFITEDSEEARNLQTALQPPPEQPAEGAAAPRPKFVQRMRFLVIDLALAVTRAIARRRAIEAARVNATNKRVDLLD